MNRIKYILIVGFLALAVIIINVSFQNGTQKADAADKASSSEPQATPVKMANIKLQNLQIWKNFSGHVVAVNHAEIRPQVSGRITELRFEDGQYVQKGDILIVIDPRPYQATLNQTRAALNVAVTQSILAEKEYQRAKDLIKTASISQGTLDKRTDRRESAIAIVEGAEALVESAKINLDYAYVKAPISGKISRAEITEGNLVQTGSNAPLLTSIIDDKHMYVDFEVDERTYLSSIKTNTTDNQNQVPVRLILLNEDLKYNGVVHSFDNRINPSSGTIRARAIFSNEDKILLPGMSVSILMGSTGDQKKILVSERAIGTDQDRKFVYIVNGDSTAKYREVKIGESINGKRVILSGLKEGEKIIAGGLVHIRPDMLVSSKTAQNIDKTSNSDALPISDEHDVSGEE